MNYLQIQNELEIHPNQVYTIETIVDNVSITDIQSTKYVYYYHHYCGTIIKDEDNNYIFLSADKKMYLLGLTIDSGAKYLIAGICHAKFRK